MVTYLMMMYVSLEQELAVKDLFRDRGWGFRKPDLRQTTEDIGPLMNETLPTETVMLAPGESTTQPQPVLQPCGEENFKMETFTEDLIQQDQQADRTSVKPRRTSKRKSKLVTSDSQCSKDTHKETPHKKSRAKSVKKQDKADQEISDIQEIVREAEMITACINDAEKHKDVPLTVTETRSDNTDKLIILKEEPDSDGDDSNDCDMYQINDSESHENKLDHGMELEMKISEMESADEVTLKSSAMETFHKSKRQKQTGKVVKQTNNKRQRKRQYDVEQLSKAYHAVMEKKMSVYRAAKEHGVPESTIRDRIRGNIPFMEDKFPVPGLGRLFSDEEERALVEHFNHMNKLGYGYLRKELILIATDYAVSLNKKHPTGILCSNWYAGFRSRFPDINQKKMQTVSVERENATSAGIVCTYYTNLKAILDTADVGNDPSSIYILDEITLPMEQRAEDVYLNTESDESHEPEDAEQTFTFIGCGNAAGSLVPPYLILPGKRWNDSYLEGTCIGSSGECSDNGDTNALILRNYFVNQFRKFVQFGKNSKPVIVLYDGQKLNLMLTLKTFGEENNVIFFVLPPHVSCITELNLDCFHPIMEEYSKECQRYLRGKNELSLEISEAGQVASKAYLKTMTPTALKSAFKQIGIYPFNSEVVRPSESDRATEYQGFLDQNEDEQNDTDDEPDD